MKHRSNGSRRSICRAFGLLDAVVIVAVLTIVASFVLVAMERAPRTARLAWCISNLKMNGTGLASYGADFQQRIASFSWSRDEGGDARGEFASPYSDDVTAAARQAVSLIRSRAERSDIQPIDYWLPNAKYTHLITGDYVAGRLPMPNDVCPDDAMLLRWQSTVRREAPLKARAALLALEPDERPTDLDDNAVQRVPYSSSYTLAAAAYSRDQREGDMRTVQSALVDHHSYAVNKARLGGRLDSEITFPSSKVLMYDEVARHGGRRPLWYAYPETSQPLLFADGSVRVVRTGDAQTGFYPNAPESKLPLRYLYKPRAFEPPARRGGRQELVTGYFAWTRGGLKGIDYDGTQSP